MGRSRIIKRVDIKENKWGCCFVDLNGADIKKPVIKLGNYIRIRINLNESAYIYIINYDKDANEARMIFPNRFEYNNIADGIMEYPKTNAFKAQEPIGLNSIFVIGSIEKINIPPFRKSDYLSFTKETLWNFLKELDKKRYDIERIEIYISEE